jgi:hypothetical protein
MIPTLVVVYDNHHPFLEDVIAKLKHKLRVVHLSVEDGLRLYSNATSTPFVEGAILFDENGDKKLARRDRYDDLVKVVEDFVGYQEQSRRQEFLSLYRNKYLEFYKDSRIESNMKHGKIKI